VLVNIHAVVHGGWCGICWVILISRHHVIHVLHHHHHAPFASNVLGPFVRIAVVGVVGFCALSTLSRGTFFATFSLALA